MSGFDLDVARLIGRELGRPVRALWQQAEPGFEAEATDIDFGPLLAGRCQLQMSLADDVASLHETLHFSKAYYAAAYEVLPGNSSFAWNRDFEGRVAVRAYTPAHSALDRLGLEWTMMRNSDEIIAAIDDGKADAGVIWGPNLSQYPRASAPLTPPPYARWNLHVASADAVLIERVDAVLPKLTSDVRDALAEHGIPPWLPFDTDHSPALLEAIE